MRFLYDLAFICFAIFYVPFFMLRLKQADSKSTLLKERFGFLPTTLTAGAKHPRIWIHAVSVGEVLSLRVFIEELYRLWPDGDVLVSVVTPTGHAVAKARLDSRVKLFYCPFDISFITRRVMRAVRPSALVLVETELWPNLIGAAAAGRVPVCVINGRLSPRSFRRYYRFRSLFKAVLRQVSALAVQNRRYRKRFARIGCAPERITVTGTMKFDVLAQKRTAVSRDDLAAWKLSCGFDRASKVIIAASTHDPEEEMCVRAFQLLRTEFPQLRLVIVPRHIDRAPAIERSAETAGLRVRLAVAPSADGAAFDGGMCDVFIVNTMGQLAQLYAYCDYVFMGGSLIHHGGQNPLEAAIQGKALVCGKYHFNFPDVYADMKKRGAVTIVDDEDGLYRALRTLIADEPRARAAGEAAAAFVEDRRGASRRNAEIVAGLIQ